MVLRRASGGPLDGELVDVKLAASNMVHMHARARPHVGPTADLKSNTNRMT